MAAGGFRVVATLVTRKSEWAEWFVALMVRTATPQESYHYRVLEGRSLARIEKQLSPAAALACSTHDENQPWRKS